jgi:hypothetical protein
MPLLRGSAAQRESGYTTGPAFIGLGGGEATAFLRIAGKLSISDETRKDNAEK